ncbi:MAG TPA: hypothetical protein VFG04_22180 [Planctomycetaceae bacterium]|jgi:hypothetical protein|nr:hypothetical protein [Planctomycetaceae bacterium]
MKTYQLLARIGHPLARPWHRLAQSRQGTVIIVVLALLGMLTLIGFFIFAFTASENQSATYFANNPSAKVPTPTIDADALFNNVLRQLIIGPAATEKQSVLYGGNKSLLPTMFGRDLSPFNGAGVNLIWNSTLNQASVDQNYNAKPDDLTAGEPDNRVLAFLNTSPAAAIAWQANTAFVTGALVRPTTTQTGFLYIATAPGTSGGGEPTWPATVGSTVTDGGVTWTAAVAPNLSSYPDPDVNATYPDINSPFLAYDALVPNSASPLLPIRVYTPSFHRPQFLRNATAAGGLGSVAVQNWYIDPLTAPLVLYPHAEHTAIDNNGNITTFQRFVTNTHPDTATTATTWAASTAYTVGQVVQPSPANGNNYLCTQAGNSGAAPPVWPTVKGSTVTDGTVIWSDTSVQAFPIPGDGATPITSEGVWTATGALPFNPATPPAMTFLVDTDNDGIPDANYIDVGFPLMTTPDGSQQFVAMAAIKLIDADALFNLNAHGNRSGNVVLGPAPIPIPFGGNGTLPATTQFLSRSNLGISASEVNVEWAFNARPVAGTPDFQGTPAALLSALTQYVSFFRSPAQSGTLPTDDHSLGNYELANMEWWNILNGRPQLTPSASPTTIAASVSGSSLPGRWGENIPRLDPNVSAVLSGTAVVQAGLGTPGGDPWPLPGTSGVDDNNNSPESGTFTDEQMIIHPAFVTPLDFFGSGTWTAAPQGKARVLITEGAQKIPQYANYFTNPTVQWTGFFAGALMSGGGGQLLVDEPDETYTEPSAVATQPNDQTFGPGEMVLALNGTDFTSFGSSSRAAGLAPFNLVSSNRAGQIRQRLTSASWDLKSFGKEFLGTYTGLNDARRLWEFTDTSPGATGVGPFRFPPDFGGTGVIPAPPLTATASTPYPLRMDLAHLLWTLADPNQLGTNTQLLSQRPLSINHLVEQVQLTNPTTGLPYTGFRFRPLTPHPTAINPPATLPNTPIVPPAHTADQIGYVINRPDNLIGANATPANQEWLARYDRQRLARDIYTLLYLTGGGNDSVNYATASNQPTGTPAVRPLYTDDQLREMAQFAVNLVDAMDPDTNITVFEYDKDLSNGWNLDDNAYDSTADLAAPFSIIPADRGVVYGVERQQLAFNEAQVTFAECTNPVGNVPADHPDTQYDENQGYWSFFFSEFENVSPFPVTFANQGWQIAIKESPINAPSGLYGQETRMIIGANQPDVQPGPNARFTVGTAGATLNGGSYVSNMNTLATPATPYPSWLVVDPNDGDPVFGGTPFDNHGTNPGFPIAPRAAFTGPTTTNPAALSLDMVLQPNNCFVMPATGGNDGIIFTPSSPTAPNGTQFVQFFNWGNILPNSAITVRIELRRRADLRRLPPVLPVDALTQSQNTTQAQDNPWIVVDYMDVPVSMLMLHPGNNYLQIQPQLTLPATGAFPFPVASTERSQPLYHANGLAPTPGKVSDIAPTWQANSLGQDNDGTNAIVPHTLFQPHYDRDFSSIIELFNVPLWGPYGPSSDTALNSSPNSGLAYRMASRSTDTGTPIGQETLAGGDWNPVAYIFVTASPPPPQVVGHSLGFGTAGYRIQHPEGGGTTPPNPTVDVTENRWHRLLGLVEVPTRSHRQLEEPPYQVTAGSIGGPLGFYRTPGKINLNTLRHADVLAGLLDSGDIYTLQYSTAFPAGLNFTSGLSVPYSVPDQNALDTFPPALVGQVTSPMAGQVRDWWLQFVTARDGTDPLPPALGGTNMALPGLPRSPSGTAPPPAGWNVPSGSHPFRGMGFSAYANAAGSTIGGVDASGFNGTLDSNILRALPGDPATIPTATTPPNTPDSRRRIFEVGMATEHASDTIDYATRNRVLSKILQNTTTRSNVFLVWMQIDFFQAKDVNPPNGVVRIGAKLASSPAYRGFFVIDRSQAMGLMGQQFLPTSGATPFVFSLNQSFNYQSLVLFRQRLQ